MSCGFRSQLAGEFKALSSDGVKVIKGIVSQWRVRGILAGATSMTSMTSRTSSSLATQQVVLEPVRMLCS